MIVWDLYPNEDFYMESSDGTDRRQPTALVIPFVHPLVSVSSHPSTSKEFVVSDVRGCVYLIDWQKDPAEDVMDSWHKHTVIELTHARTLADATVNMTESWSGCASWKPDNPDM